MRSICRTVYGSALQAARYLGAQFPILPNTTLNEWVANIGTVFNTFTWPMVGSVAGQIGSNVQPILVGTNTQAFSLGSYNQITDTAGMEVQYLAIGNGGTYYYSAPNPDTNNAPPYLGPIPHLAYHAGLYSMTPWVLRLINNDLTPLQRTNYRLRTFMVIGGQWYVAYFLKLLTTVEPTVQMEYVTVTGGVTTESALAPDLNSWLLAPTKPLMPGGVIPTTSNYLATVSNIALNFTAADVAELINVATILYGNPNQAIISELGICQGADKPVQQYVYDGTSSVAAPNLVPDSTAGVVEACGAQISTFLSAYYPISFTNDGFAININLGTTEPLYGTIGA